MKLIDKIIEILVNYKYKKDPYRCPYCNDGQPLVTGQADDYGIAIHYPKTLVAYGYDVHGSNSNGICIEINFCPMCGQKLGRKE